MAKIDRREFLRQSALLGGYCLAGDLALAQGVRIALITDPTDPVASSPPVRWATDELQKALADRGATVDRLPSLSSADAYNLRIIVAGPQMLQLRSLGKVPDQSQTESLTIVPMKPRGKQSLLASGSDVRGLMYAVLELADRVQCSATALENLNFSKPVIETPANRVRSVTRLFVSDVEDKPWYNDRDFWPPYLSMLAAQRFNRFSLGFGLGYDFTNHISDCYFHFAYPFLLAVPGYDVRAAGLPDEERDYNLEMLRYISDQATAHGVEFQLGLWTHAYQWVDSPNANYTISGLTPGTHAAYSREALRLLLEKCPSISSVAFRVHGESGVAEESYAFWKTVFDGVVESGRKIEINLHAKGLDEKMIDVALGTGMPVSLSPKYWAEHMGLPYHQAAIRDLEKPPRERQSGGFFALSSGSRQFLRYGYGDLMKAGRRYQVYSRVWPGTQRVLLWGDPTISAGYGRASQFAGQEGADFFEPLSFKGRRGSGRPGGRCGYADTSLSPQYDWQKFSYTYRMWGRHLYNPDADAENRRRFLSAHYQSAAPHVELALANASRILPLVTTAHGPSAANNTYWPEMYTNMPDVDEGHHPLYGDSPRPRVFGHASPFDPQLFASVDEFARELLDGIPSGKTSPIQVASWLEEMADAAAQHLAQAEALIGQRSNPDFRRLALDVAILSGLGKFFADKFRSGVLYSIFDHTRDVSVLQNSLRLYREARNAWAELAKRADGAYASDITFGPESHLRGHWIDRLAGIDYDIAGMEQKLAAGTAAPSTYSGEQIKEALQYALSKPKTLVPLWHHTSPAQFRPGEALPLELALERDRTTSSASVRLFYRHVDQAEDYEIAEMRDANGRYTAVIPAPYTRSPYALEYYFQVRAGNAAWLLPGVNPDVPLRPYFFVSLAGSLH